MDASKPDEPHGGEILTGPSLNLGASQPVSHAIMFYVLSLVAMIIFAPCVLVPIWRDVQKLGEDERTMAALVAQLNQQIQRNNERIEALQADPQVINRVARRELNRQPADEQHIRWSQAEMAAVRLNLPTELCDSPPPPPLAMPVWVVQMSSWLPAWANSDLFAKSPNREMMLVMAGSLLLTAFVLYTPKAESRVEKHVAERV
jgi:hypothetical protein